MLMVRSDGVISGSLCSVQLFTVSPWQAAQLGFEPSSRGWLPLLAQFERLNQIMG